MRCQSGDKQQSGGGVDLGGVRSIHHIVILYSTRNIVWGTVCFKVQLNNVLMFNWKILGLGDF